MSNAAVIVGITGASGAVYGRKLLQLLRAANVSAHLIVSKAGQLTVRHELGADGMEQLRTLATTTHAAGDVGACIASGSYPARGMIIAPCSMKTLGEIASGVTASLVSRAADVTLKERRRLILMVRETPLTSIHLQNMLTVTQAGGIIAPPVPAFYTFPEDLDALVTHSAARVLDLLEIESHKATRWEGLKPDAIT